MALIAKLYGDDRSAERHGLGAEATMRGADRVPVDVVVVDLSHTGCLFVTTESLDIGSIVTIGIAGIGLREARIVRNQDVRFGCTFLTPLAGTELTAGLAESKTVTFFPFQHSSTTEQEAAPIVAKLPRLMRLAALVVLVAVSWVFVAVLVKLM